MASLKDLTTLIVDSYKATGAANKTGGLDYPSRARVTALLSDIEELIFPGFSADDAFTDETLELVTGVRVARLLDGLTAQKDRDFAVHFLEQIPALRASLNLDVDALLAGDPAVRSREEVILAYPGLRAVLVHRVAHVFWKNGLRLLARMMSETIHGQTGIDIHPGATIGKSFYIDHGTGVVVGETTIIGDHVKLYQGVSLGALSVSKRLQDKRRHPTIEDHVTIYAGATILGGDTVVGHHTVVGGNVWLVKSVPPYSLVEHAATISVGSRNQTPSFDPSI